MFRDLSVIRALEPVLSAIALVGWESLCCPYGSAWLLPAVRQFVSAHISTFLRIAASVSQAYALMRCAPIKSVLAKALCCIMFGSRRFAQRAFGSPADLLATLSAFIL